MRRLVLPVAFAMVIGVVGQASAAEVVTSAAKSSAIAGMSGIQLPMAQSTAPQKNIVVAKRRVWRGVAIGAAIIGTAIIASEAARAESRRRARRHRRNCRNWFNRCNRGNDRACWRYDNQC